MFLGSGRTVENHGTIVLHGELVGEGIVENHGAIVVKGTGMLADHGHGNGIDSLLVRLNNYELTLDAYGGSFGSGGSARTLFVYARTVRRSGQSLPAPTKAGFVFMGWNTKENGSGDEVDEKTDLTGFGAGPTAVALFARWEVAYTLTFDPNTAEPVNNVNNMPNQLAVEGGQTTILPAVVPTPGRVRVQRMEHRPDRRRHQLRAG